MNEEREDSELLRRFVRMKSDAAFTELVQKHVDLVYSAALRQLRGDSSLARDATQAVFCELARNAGKLLGRRTVAGWLYTTARFVASRMNRSELRRVARETAFAMKTAEESIPEVGWKDVEQLLDEAMQDLSSEEREAVLLRYFRKESFAGIGEVLGATENAARMRVERALEKLRVALRRRGVTCPASVLSALLAANAIGAAPSGLAGAVALPALSAAAAGSLLPKALTFLEFMSATKIKTAAAIVAIAGTTTGWVVAKRNAIHLEEGIARMRQQMVVQPRDTTAPDGMQWVSDEELQRLRAQHSELMRLRGEVTQLRRQLREQPVASAAAPAARIADHPQENARKDRLKNLGIARMTMARDWGMAFYKFAETNDGFMPGAFDQATGSYPEIKPELLQMLSKSSIGGSDGDDFEITFQGRLKEIANPAQAIIMRDKEPFEYGPDGAAYRTYLFADGHSEVHKAQNGDFTAWEMERQPVLKVEEAAPSE